MKYFQLLIIVTVLFTNSMLAQDITKEDIIVPEKNPAVSFIGSLIIPGLGQMYNERLTMGFFNFGLAAASATAIIIGSQEKTKKNGSEELYNIGICVYVANALISIIEAPLTSNSINKENRIKAARLRKIFSCIEINPYFNNYSCGFSLIINY